MEDLKTAIQNNNIFYIHLNNMNIGNRIGSQNITINWDQHKNRVMRQTKSNYITLFNQSLKTDNMTLEALSDFMGLNQQQLITKINKSLGKKLQEEIDLKSLANLHKMVKQGDVSKYIKNSITENGDNVEELKQALRVVAKCLKLLQEKRRGGALGAILLNTINGQRKNKDGTITNFSVSNFKELGKELATALEDYKVINDYRKIQKDALNDAKSLLYNLSYVLQERKFKSSGRNISAKGLSRLILNNIVSTAIAQGLGFVIQTKSQNLLYKATISSTGTAQVQSDSELSDKKITGKTDVKIQNVNYKLDLLDYGETSGSLMMDIGLSLKFYTGQKFNNLSNKGENQIISTQSINSGSGGTLGEAIYAIFDQPVDKYLIYNYYAHSPERSYEILKMNDLILKRQILRLFASAGKKDFSQFMLINGEIISIWDIVQYALDSDLYLSQSQDGSKQQGLALSIPDRPKIVQANVPIFTKNNQILNAWQRSINVNKVINSATIKAELHLKNLAKYYNEN